MTELKKNNINIEKNVATKYMSDEIPNNIRIARQTVVLHAI